MRLVYSRNKTPVGNTSPGMEHLHVRDEPARIVHVLSELPGRTGVGPVTLCGAPVSEDPVPAEILLPNCGNCFQAVRRARQQIMRIRKRAGI